MLPAREGDVLWIRWGPEGGPIRQMLVDMGTEATGRTLRQRLEALPAAQRRFELLVVTHVDRDHIGGVLTCFAEADPLDELEIADVWFNGWQHLHGETVPNADTEGMPGELETWGPAQGERLSTWLAGQRWNGAFDGGPICRVPGERPVTKTLAGDLRLTILGPTPQRLTDFIDTWKDEVQAALRKGRITEVAPGLEVYGSEQPPRLDSANALRRLAEREKSKKDSSEANGSSIALLLELEGQRLLLAGDAYPWDLVAGLEALGEDLPIELDAVKLSHHGSAKNLTEDFVKAVRTPLWLISTDGNRFKHPDAIAVARVLRSSEAPRTLCFNAPSKYNGWWRSAEWQERFNYSTRYGTARDGLTVIFGA